MTFFTRGVLQEAFPDNPRVRAALEKVDELLTATDENGKSLGDKLERLAAIVDDDTKYQRAHDLLKAIAELPNRIGAIEISETGLAVIRPIDGQDPASLLSRGVGYTLFVGIGGRGPTANRPPIPAKAGALYFDTTLDPDGQPIFWTGITWVNANGVPV
jgi:hypothetical protein